MFNCSLVVAGKSQSLGGHTTAWFQQYLLATNRALMKNQHNNQSCWPVWGDNHAAMFTTVPTQRVIANLNKGLEEGSIKEEWAQWHGFLGMENGEKGFGHTAMYVMEPSGWQLEVNSPWTNPDPNTNPNPNPNPDPNPNPHPKYHNLGKQG